MKEYKVELLKSIEIQGHPQTVKQCSVFTNN